LDLGSGEEDKAIRGTVRHDIDGGGSAKSSLGSSIHGGNVRRSDESIRSRDGAGDGVFVWSSKIKSLQAVSAAAGTEGALQPITV
jgi:hypothetical protein